MGKEGTASHYKKPFDELSICLNCPRKKCVYDKNDVVVCPVIKEKREEYRKGKEGRKRKKL